MHGAGSVNLRSEMVNVKLNTESAHFSIGSLPMPINGPLRSLNIRSEVGKLAMRANPIGHQTCP